MATKTISIDLEAYEKLVAARSNPKESFSNVIKRAEIKSVTGRAGNLLAVIETLPPLNDEAFKRWGTLTDRKAKNPWRE
jgi:predicted CopG family antitoxin